MLKSFQLLLLTLLATLSFSPINAELNYELQTKNIVQSEIWIAKKVSENKCDDCLSGKNFEIEVSAKASNAKNNFVVPSEITSIQEMLIFESILFVIGELPFGGSAVYVHDLIMNEKVTEFYGYNLHHSLDNRYFLFRKFFPRMGSDRGTIIQMFDAKLIETGQFGGSQIQPEEVGQQIYPDRNDSSNSIAAPAFQLEQVIFNDESKFVSFFGLDNNSNLVLITRELWQENPTVTVNNCTVPFANGMIESEYLREAGRNIVEIISMSNPDEVSVYLYDSRGVRSHFMINLGNACN